MDASGDRPGSIAVAHAPEDHRYEVRDGGVTVGHTSYRLTDEQHVEFRHTEVDDAYEGQGLASRLVAHAVADVRTSGRRVIPSCPYVAAWLRRHEEHHDITDWPEPEPGA